MLRILGISGGGLAIALGVFLWARQRSAGKQQADLPNEEQFADTEPLSDEEPTSPGSASPGWTPPAGLGYDFPEPEAEPIPVLPQHPKPRRLRLAPTLIALLAAAAIAEGVLLGLSWERLDDEIAARQSLSNQVAELREGLTTALKATVQHREQLSGHARRLNALDGAVGTTGFSFGSLQDRVSDLENDVSKLDRCLDTLIASVQLNTLVVSCF